jgi:hypothetical protein
LPVKHFEIPFRATRAQYADHAPDFFNKNDAATGTVKKPPLGRHWTRDVLLPRLLSGQVELYIQAA